MHSDFRFAVLWDQYKGSNYWAVSSISSRISRYINLKLTFIIVFVSILVFTFSNFKFLPNCQKLWHLKNQLFLLLHTAWISLAYPLSPLPLTCDTHVVFVQWNVSQCVYEYLTFQTQIHLHKQYIFDTNIIQSEYAYLFPFSIDWFKIF